MNTEKNQENRPQRQTAENPSGEPLTNPFSTNRTAKKNIQQAKVELDKEQQLKEAQTERD